MRRLTALFLLCGAGCIPIHGETSRLHSDMAEARLNSCAVEDIRCGEHGLGNSGYYCSSALISGGSLSYQLDGKDAEDHDGQHQCLAPCADSEFCPVGYECQDREHDGGIQQLCVRQTLCRGDAHCVNPYYGQGAFFYRCERATPTCRLRLEAQCDRDSDCSKWHAEAYCYMERCEFTDAEMLTGDVCPDDQYYTGRCQARQDLSPGNHLPTFFEQAQVGGRIGPDGECGELGAACDLPNGETGQCGQIYDSRSRCYPSRQNNAACPGGYAPYGDENLCAPLFPCRSNSEGVRTHHDSSLFDCSTVGTQCSGEQLCVDQRDLSCVRDSDCRNHGFSCYLGLCVADSGECSDLTNVQVTRIPTCQFPEGDM